MWSPTLNGSAAGSVVLAGGDLLRPQVVERGDHAALDDLGELGAVPTR